MKKYIIPSTKIVEVKIMSMIAASVNSISSDEGDEGSEDNPVNFSRRHNSFWDDEEDD